MTVPSRIEDHSSRVPRVFQSATHTTDADESGAVQHLAVHPALADVTDVRTSWDGDKVSFSCNIGNLLRTFELRSYWSDMLICQPPAYYIIVTGIFEEEHRFAQRMHLSIRANGNEGCRLGTLVRCIPMEIMRIEEVYESYVRLDDRITIALRDTSWRHLSSKFAQLTIT
jgi:hypothetical protein